MIPYDELIWSSDWSGDEVGYPDVEVVGLYSLKSYPFIYVYINAETNQVLEAWYMEE